MLTVPLGNGAKIVDDLLWNDPARVACEGGGKRHVALDRPRGRAQYGHQGDATTMTTDLLGRANSRCSMRFPRPLDACQDVRQLAPEQWCLARRVRVFGVG